MDEMISYNKKSLMQKRNYVHSTARTIEQKREKILGVGRKEKRRKIKKYTLKGLGSRKR